MAFIKKAITAANVQHGTTFVNVPRGGDFSSTNYDIFDDSFAGATATGDLSYLNNRLNDVRYYTGDTPN